MPTWLPRLIDKVVEAKAQSNSTTCSSDGLQYNTSSTVQRPCHCRNASWFFFKISFRWTLSLTLKSCCIYIYFIISNIGNACLLNHVQTYPPHSRVKTFLNIMRELKWQKLNQLLTSCNVLSSSQRSLLACKESIKFI